MAIRPPLPPATYPEFALPPLASMPPAPEIVPGTSRRIDPPVPPGPLNQPSPLAQIDPFSVRLGVVRVIRPPPEPPAPPPPPPAPLSRPAPPNTVQHDVAIDIELLAATPVAGGVSAPKTLLADVNRSTLLNIDVARSIQVKPRKY